MNDKRSKRLAQLRQAYESGTLDEDTYQTAVTTLAGHHCSGRSLTVPVSGVSDAAGDGHSLWK